MYDPSISEVKNAKNIGVSRNTLRKYIEKLGLSSSLSKDKSVSFEVEDEDIDSWIDSVLE